VVAAPLRERGVGWMLDGTSVGMKELRVGEGAVLTCKTVDTVDSSEEGVAVGKVNASRTDNWTGWVGVCKGIPSARASLNRIDGSGVETAGDGGFASFSVEERA